MLKIFLYYETQYNFVETFNKIFGDTEIDLVYDVCHNIGKFEEHKIDGKTKEVCVHRKGATRAFAAGRKECHE